MKKKMNRKMSRKKATVLLMTGILAASLTACQNKKDDSEKTKIEGNSKAMVESTDDMLSGSYESEASYYRQVLDNSVPFISTNAEEGDGKVYLDEFADNEYISYNLSSFAYLDLDEDGKKEVVILMETESDVYYEVLKEIGGTVYGYFFHYRCINELYADGTMLGSNGDACCDIYRMQLSTTGSTVEIESRGYEAGESKPHATWYDFTDEDIENVFGEADMYGEDSYEEDSYEDDDFYSSTDANRDAYIQVLNSYDSFKDTDNGGDDVYLDDFAYQDEYTEDPKPYTINKFAYLDLDLDGEKEVVLEMDYGFDGAFEVLKEIDGTVYGYNFGYRSINPLYEDGTMMGSSGAADSEIYRLQFSTIGYTEDVIDSTGATGVTKTLATWYDFTTENIDKILGNDSQETFQSDSQGTFQNDSLSGLLTINQKSDGCVFYESDEEYLSEDMMQYIPTEILRIARNEIYARHGYQFTSEMKTFFENKSWYRGTVSASDWSDSKLNVYEKKNVELFQKYEALGAKVPFTTSSVAGGTQINGDGFTITLPSEWNSSNYFAVKTRENDHDAYIFYSKNNYAYGYNGVVFSLLVYDKPLPQNMQLGYDGFVELGNDGNHYFYMGGPTDIQYSYDIPALESEYMQLYNTYSEIVDSFEM